ncbi:lasso peptide biosynthesis B2 protein [Streptomyces sp. NPDC000594]|uniref:lasso peptide biosynthesis B2 protein n=1 Tax=Streptomyces sp. NPDC000594 TaxID=3154261 RepID=UPI00332CADD8
MTRSRTPQVHTALLPGGSAAVMDIRKGRGRWRHLNASAAHLWRDVTEGMPLDRAVERLAVRLEAQGAEPTTLWADLDALTGQLAETGLLTADTAPPLPPENRTIRTPLPPGTPLTGADRSAGFLGLLTALTLLRCSPFRTTVGTARALGHLGRTPATADQTDRLFHAVRHFARLWPGRAACLEESLAVYLAAALRGLQVTWVLGARTAPAAAHAWVEAEGEVIGQDPADRTWPYVPALKVSSERPVPGVNART